MVTSHPSLLDKLRDDRFEELNVGLGLGGINTRVQVDKNTGNKSITIGNLVLNYNSQLFDEHSLLYVNEQTLAHLLYRDIVKKQFSSYRDSPLFGQEKDMNELMQFLSQNSARRVAKVARILSEPIFWLKLGTFRDYFQQILKKSDDSLEGHRLIEQVIDDGREFIQDKITESRGKLPSKVIASLENWEGIQGEISNTYGRIVNLANRELKFHKMMTELFYPSS